MTAREAIDRADALLPNPVEEAEKLRWLEAFDGQLLGKEVSRALTDSLTVRAPYDEVYVHWLQAKILYFLGEYGRYQNAMAQFNALYLEYTASLIRAAKPTTDARLRY